MTVVIPLIRQVEALIAHADKMARIKRERWAVYGVKGPLGTWYYRADAAGNGRSR